MPSTFSVKYFVEPKLYLVLVIETWYILYEVEYDIYEVNIVWCFTCIDVFYLW